MDFTNRSIRQPSEPAAPNAVTPKANKKSRFKKPTGGFLNIVYIGLLFCVTIIIAGVITSLILSDNNKEDKYVDKNKLQAVFLNNGQVYFGNVTALNSDYMKLNNIYYLRVNQQVQPGQQANQNDVSLAKLGCELHGPQDQMIINRNEITFWENLKDDGQVAKAVAEFVKANPNGQVCQENTSSNSSSDDSASTGNAANTNNTTTGNTAAPSANTPATNNTQNNTTNR